MTEETSGRDYTQVPKQLDEEFEKRLVKID